MSLFLFTYQSKVQCLITPEDKKTRRMKMRLIFIIITSIEQAKTHITV
jgi:hypothetical protein